MAMARIKYILLIDKNSLSRLLKLLVNEKVAKESLPIKTAGGGKIAEAIFVQDAENELVKIIVGLLFDVLKHDKQAYFDKTAILNNDGTLEDAIRIEAVVMRGFFEKTQQHFKGYLPQQCSIKPDLGN